jgi:hypothetical protein
LTSFSVIAIRAPLNFPLTPQDGAQPSRHENQWHCSRGWLKPVRAASILVRRSKSATRFRLPSQFWGFFGEEINRHAENP